MTDLKTLRIEAKKAGVAGAWKMTKANLTTSLERVPAEPLNDYRLDAENRVKNAELLDAQRGIRTSKNNDLYLPQTRRVGYRVLRKEVATDKLSNQHRIVLASVKDARFRTCDEIAHAALENGLQTVQKPAYIAATALSKFVRLGLVEKIKLPKEA
jgi:hypothetical protein